MKHLQPLRVGDVFLICHFQIKPVNVLYDSVKTKRLGFWYLFYKEKSNKMLPSVLDNIRNLL